MSQPLPAPFAFIRDPAFAHALVIRAASHYGLQERPGNADNPVILDMAKLVQATAYKYDSVPWCGLFMAWVCINAPKPKGNAALWALNWADVGTPVDRTKINFGDVITLQRKQGGKVIGGHVTLYIASDGAGGFWGLGGNQGDAVNIKRFARSQIYRARRLITYKGKAPPIVQYAKFQNSAGKLI